MTDEIVGHLMERLAIPKPEEIHLVDRKKPAVSPSDYLPFQAGEDLVPEMATFGEGYRFYASGLTHDETGHPRTDSAEHHAKLVQRLCDKIRNNAEKITRVERVFMDDADICIVAYGSVARSALAAAVEGRQRGIKIGLLRLVTIWPFPDDIVEQVAEQVDKIVVPEMNYGQLVREVERNAGRRKVQSLPKLGDALHTPQEILAHAFN
jgi:2-oxoglutarate ferredoxin oxidoreductase subunit alpha